MSTLPTNITDSTPSGNGEHAGLHNNVNALVNQHDATIATLAPLNSPTFTGTVGGITAGMVGAPSGTGTSSGTNTGDQTLSLAGAVLTISSGNGVTISTSNVSGLATVASSGSYTDLINKPAVSGTNTGDQTLSYNSSTAILTISGSNGNSVTLNTGGSTTLAGDTDVAITSPTNGQALIYNSTSAKWQNTTLSGGGDMLKATYDPAGVAQQLVGTTATQALTNKDLTGTGNTFPTFNQNTTGTASNVTGTVAIAHGGTGQTTASAAFNGLSPLTTLGDLLYASAANTSSRLAGNTTTTKKFLIQTGTGTVSAAPSWGTIAASDVPTLNQNTTGTAANVTGTVAITNGGTGVTTLPTGILKGAGTGAITAVTAPTGAIVGTSDTQTITNKTLDQTNAITFNNVTVLGGSGAPSTPAAGLATFFGIGTTNLRPGWMNQTGILERIATDQGMTGFGQAWQNPTLGTGWANLDAGGAGAYGGPQYMMDGVGFVHLRGLAKNSSAGSNSNANNATIFTLPVGYRPSQRVRVGTDFSDAFGEIDIMDTGAVIIAGGSPSNVAPGAWASLNNIVFRAEQ